MSAPLSLHVQTLVPKMITHLCSINFVWCMSVTSSIPISIVPLEDISTPAWTKEHGFDQLKIAVSYFKSTHQLENLIEFVSTEIPIDVHFAAQDAMKKMQRVLASAYDINNLNISTFLTTTGKRVQLKSEKLADRPEEFSIFRFSYNLDPTSIDPRIM